MGALRSFNGNHGFLLPPESDLPSETEGAAGVDEATIDVLDLLAETEEEADTKSN